MERCGDIEQHVVSITSEDEYLHQNSQGRNKEHQHELYVAKKRVITDGFTCGTQYIWNGFQKQFINDRVSNS